MNSPPLSLQQQALFKKALALHQGGEVEAARTLYHRLLKDVPVHADVLRLLGTAESQLGNPEAGIQLIGQSLDIAPNQPEAHHNRANILQAVGRLVEAVAGYEKALALRPAFADAWFCRGNALRKLDQAADAATSYQRALSARPNYIDAWLGLGALLMQYEQIEAALASFDKILDLIPTHAEALNNRGTALRQLDRLAEALESYDNSLAIRPDFAEAHYNRGAVLQLMDRPEDALRSYDRALSLRANITEAFENRGKILHAIKRFDEAIANYDAALSLKPNSADAWYKRGLVHMSAGRQAEALHDYERAVSINPKSPWLPGMVLHLRMHVADWSDFDGQLERLTQRVAADEKGSAPLPLLAVLDSPELHLKNTRQYGRTAFPTKGLLPELPSLPKHKRIRIGYFSPDFGDHPVSHLLAGAFECHDRTAFEIFAFSFKPGPDDAWQTRIRAAADHFIEVPSKSDREVAELARALEIDIAVDLSGYTEGSRTAIFAERAAPIQVGYLGYPATMGMDAYDYMLADQVLIPERDRAFYAEKIAYLPCYQINDNKRIISNRTFTRRDLGLPDEGFVFCAFNQSFKITPDVYTSWMRILTQVPGSVLWLSVSDPMAQNRLKAEAQTRGVDAGRLVFSQRLSLEDHLARHRSAGLFLDTSPYSAMVTASNALRAGLPVLTHAGRSFASRMGASLLHAVGLSELVTATPEEYEKKAVELATTPEYLATIRKRLADNLPNGLLFDTEKITWALEDLYREMYRRCCDGLSPDHL